MLNPSTHQIKKRAFTLIELLVVVSIASFLMAAFGVTLANYLENAREAQTLATLTKVDGLISERTKALERAYSKPEFKTFANQLHKLVVSGDVDGNGTISSTEFPMPGFSREATEILARKSFHRILFPQYFVEDFPFGTQFEKVQSLLNKEHANGTLTIDWSKHEPKTESSEILYYALTRMEILGAPPIGDEFASQELKDTDGDGLLEIVDGWGNPIRFYRSPTRLIKPYGAFGPDGLPGNGPDQLIHLGEVTNAGPSDDHLITTEWRRFAGLFISGLPREPFRTATGGTIVAFDQLGQDPDDPYGLLISEFKRLSPNLSQLSSTGLINTELGQSSPFWNFPTFDVYHKPLVVSAGPDGELGILEPFPTNDFDANGSISGSEDLYSDGQIYEFGHLACPRMVSKPTRTRTPAVAPYSILPIAFSQATDNLTNRRVRR